MDGKSDTESAWETLGHVPPDVLPDDRLQLHHAVQLLSAFGQTYLEVGRFPIALGAQGRDARDL